MSKVMAQVKKPNFPEYKAEASTTHVDVSPNLNISPSPPKKYNVKSQTFKPSVMWKDLKKGVSMLFGYQDKPIPPKT